MCIFFVRMPQFLLTFDTIDTLLLVYSNFLDEKIVSPDRKLFFKIFRCYIVQKYVSINQESNINRNQSQQIDAFEQKICICLNPKTQYENIYIFIVTN